MECYEKALEMQPTLWCAFERLCKMVGGPYSHAKVDAAKIFQDNNADMNQMNSMIREHMNNIQQHTSVYNGVTVGNFDQSPMNDNYANQDDLKDGKNSYQKGFQTNQKTPIPSKNTQKQMKENL